MLLLASRRCSARNRGVAIPLGSLPLSTTSDMSSAALFTLPVVVIVAFFVIPNTVKILRQYERPVVFTSGRF
jgi:hypothetical protein